MKRFLVILFVLLLVLAFAVPAVTAAGPCDDAGGVGASDYALNHILVATANGDHVPGTHMGYSLCLGVHG
jgi:hypothetical protein